MSERERERKQTKQAKQKHKTNMHNKISFIIKFMFGKLCSVLSTIFYSLSALMCVGFNEELFEMNGILQLFTKFKVI